MNFLEGLMVIAAIVALWSTAVACESIADELTLIRKLIEAEE